MLKCKLMPVGKGRGEDLLESAAIMQLDEGREDESNAEQNAEREATYPLCIFRFFFVSFFFSSFPFLLVFLFLFFVLFVCVCVFVCAHARQYCCSTTDRDPPSGLVSLLLKVVVPSSS